MYEKKAIARIDQINSQPASMVIERTHGTCEYDGLKLYLEAIKKAEGLAKAVKLYLKLDKDGYPIGTDVNLEEALDKWNKEK